MAKAKTKTTALTAAKEGMLALEGVARQVQKEIIESEGVLRTLAMAQGIVAISEAFNDQTVAVLMQLQGSDFGFRTDKDDNGGYDAATVKEVAVRALMHGANLHGGEFSIIAKGCYLSQAFYLRKLREYPGAQDIVIQIDAPDDDGKLVGKNKEFRIGGYASCRVDGKLVEVFCRKHPKFGDSRVVVSAYNNSTALDGCLGKAKKRIAQKLYERIAGVSLSDDEDSGGVVRVIDPSSIEDQDTAGEESQVPPEKTNAERWDEEFERHGVTGQGQLLREAPTAEDRDAIMTASKSQFEAGEINQQAFDLLARYAESKST